MWKRELVFNSFGVDRNSHEMILICKKKVVIPAFSEMLVPGFPTDRRNCKGHAIVVEAVPEMLGKYGLQTSDLVADGEQRVIPVRLMNFSSHSVMLKKKTILAKATSVSDVVSFQSFGKAQETEIPKEEKPFEFPKCNFDQMEDRDVKDLKGLLEDTRDLWSQGGHDLGRTSYVEHEIELIEGTKPIKQACR